MANAPRWPQIEFRPVSSRFYFLCPATAHHIYRLPNDYGLSVVHQPGRDSDAGNRWEASIVVFHGPCTDCYQLLEDEFDSDVRDCLTDEHVAALLLSLARRPRRSGRGGERVRHDRSPPAVARAVRV